MSRQPLTILLASPRSFCAGVERAVLIVEKALLKWGAPIYVRHPIIHNAYACKELMKKGAIFVEELQEIPLGPSPVIFSAHGVSKAVVKEAKERGFVIIDATCPLVQKIHLQVCKNASEGIRTILIGHRSHPEVEGTMGQVKAKEVVLIETCKDVEALSFPPDTALSYVTQTTLSVNETENIIAALKKKFPAIKPPHSQSICYATTNRQEAVKALAQRCHQLWVLGDMTSSNSLRLLEVSRTTGCSATLLKDENSIPWKEIVENKKIGLTASASAPETLVQRVIASLKEQFHVTVEELEIARETLQFKLPAVLR